MSGLNCWGRRFFVSVLIFLVVSPGLAHAEAAREFKSLVEQGKTLLRQGDLTASVARFRAAAALKPSPRLLMTSVSLYADIARQSNTPLALCDETQDSLRQFFRDCGQCSDLSQGRCKLCAHVQANDGDRRLVSRVDRLAERFIERSEVLADQAASEKGSKRARSQRRSEGFSGKARALRRCLGRLTLTSNPPGATIRSAGQAIGLTPETVLFFTGRQAISFDLDGRPTQRRSVEIRSGQNPSLHVGIVPGVKERPVAPGAAAVATVPPASVGERDWFWPSVSLAMGTLAVGAGTYMLVESKRDNDRLVAEVERLERIQFESMGNEGNGGDEVGLSDEALADLEKDNSDSVSLNRNGIISVSVGVVCVGAAGYWLYRTLVRDDETEAETKESVQLGLSPSSVSLHFSF